MKLFYKHLLRSIRKKPTQPLILVLTLLLSVAVSVLALAMRDTLTEETARERELTYGSADLSVRLNSTSRSRFLFCEDAEAALEGQGTVLGLYELPARAMGISTAAVAADIVRYGAVLPLRLYESLPLTEAALSEVVFVSASFAEEQGITVGQALGITVLGRERSMTVGAIAEGGFAGGADLLLPIDSIARTLAASSPLLAALGNGFRPAGTLYIDLADRMTEEEAIARLEASPTLSDKTVLSVKGYVEGNASLASADIVVLTLILITAALSVAVTYCCFSILAAERVGENAVFAAAGASPRALRLAQYAEVLLYWAVAAPLGCLLAVPALHLLLHMGRFRYATATLQIGSLLGGAAIPLLSSLLSVTVLLLAGRHRSRPNATRPSRTYVLPAVGGVTLLSALALLIVPPTARFSVGVLLLGAFLLLAFLAASPLLRRMAAAMAARRASRGTARRYACSNIVALPLLRNFSRLLMLLVTLLFTAALLLTSALHFFSFSRSLFTGELLITGATERCYESCRGTPGVKEADGVYFSSGIAEDGTLYSLLSAEDIGALSPRFSLDERPMKEEAAIASEIAVRQGLAVGDSFTLTVEGRPIHLRVGKILALEAPLIVFDAPYHGLAYHMLLVTGDGTDTPLLRERLTVATALEFVDIMPTEELWALRIKSFEIYVSAAILLIGAALVFSVIGLLNTVTQSYRARREDFRLFSLGGMSPTAIRCMKRHELLVTSLFGVALGLLLFLLTTPLLQYALSAMHDLLAFL